jgi:[ribosomal protein S5]-alanine N-acetyltransferase
MSRAAKPVRSAARAPLQMVRTGERVSLRVPNAADADELIALRRRSMRRLRPWDPKPAKGTTAWGPDWVERLLASRRSVTHCKLLVCRNADGAIVGGASLNEIVRGAFHNAFAGWWLGDPFEGHGYMTEGLALLVEHGFLELRLHRIEANIRPENARSKSLALRVGFRLEGYSPRYLQIAGRWADHERYAMVVEEWRSRRRSVPHSVVKR